jgi:uncharacterized membrane protein
MDSPEPGQTQATPKAAIIVMVIIVVALALVSLFANIQRAHRDRVEQVIVRSATPTPSPATR